MNFLESMIAFVTCWYLLVRVGLRVVRCEEKLDKLLARERGK